MGFVPVASPITSRFLFTPGRNASTGGKTTVTVALAPGARFDAVVAVVVTSVPSRPKIGVTLAAGILPVFCTDIVTTKSPFDCSAIERYLAEMVMSGNCTVSLVLPEIDPSVAVMVDVPRLTPVATSPIMVATTVFEEVQVTEDVRFCVLPSLKVPVATNVCVAPAGIAEFAGVTAIDCSVITLT